MQIPVSSFWILVFGSGFQVPDSGLLSFRVAPSLTVCLHHIQFTYGCYPAWADLYVFLQKYIVTTIASFITCSCDEMTQNPSTRSHKHKTNLRGNAYSSSYCLHMPTINWYCLDNILTIFLITPFKTSLLYNLSWKSNTWNVMPLALTKYLYMKYNLHLSTFTILFTFIVTLLCHFPSLEDRTSTLGKKFASGISMNSQGVITIKSWLILAKEAFKCQIIMLSLYSNFTLLFVYIYNYI